MSEMQSLNADIKAFIQIDTHAMAWQSSPSPTVHRKRLHLYGPKESGQVTSIVRYDPDSSFHEHGHPEGEEILVLDGIFSDQSGDWEAGSYLLNPEGFRHAPFSKQGCIIFVKLRQYIGTQRQHVTLTPEQMAWKETGIPGRMHVQLYAEEGYPETMHLVRLAPHTPDLGQTYMAGAEILVLAGTLEDQHGQHGPGAWVRFPPGAHHLSSSTEGCRYYLKEGALPHLRSPDSPASLAR